MSDEQAVGRVIGRLVRFFLPLCQDQRTLLELEKMAADDKRWGGAHDLFDRIRRKRNAATKPLLDYQYSFEEICAKTLFNLSYPRSDAPFDDDSAFWVVPFAISFARASGVYERFCASTEGLLAEAP
ncbi:MAG TPA: hypothetical protein VFG04_13460 [Planctomycetaceae bacterium]|jgi:hypothetical protein|nr:hypothetical protein [Planctomycetaceae bacterium]